MAAVTYAGNDIKLPGHITKILLDESWNGKRIELKIGDEVQIELQGIGATGYAWYFDKLNSNFFHLISQEREKGKKEGEEVVGVPIRHIWVIKAKKIGTSIIEMSYYRVWEGRDKAIRQFKVEVDIIP
jgi:predicted secreted protein